MYLWFLADGHGSDTFLFLFLVKRYSKLTLHLTLMVLVLLVLLSSQALNHLRLRGQIIHCPFGVPSAQRPFSIDDGRNFERFQVIHCPFVVPSAQRPFAMGALGWFRILRGYPIPLFTAHSPICSDGTGDSIHSRIEE